MSYYNQAACLLQYPHNHVAEGSKP